MYDVVVVGGGPAGLTAALYTARRTLKTLIIAKDLGGQMATTTDIENYPGFPEPISGFELANRMKRQAEKFGAEFKFGDVNKIEKQDGQYIIYYSNESVKAESVILAFGLTPRNLEVPGEQEYKNKGVSYCANCDAPLYKGKRVVVVGGGNSALDAADYLAKVAAKVYLIHRRDQFRAEEIIVKQIVNNQNIEILYDTVVTEIKGKEIVTGVTIKNVKTNEINQLAVEGIFVEIGRKASTEFLQGLVELNDRREIIVDNYGRTSDPGIFAAGDVTNINQKQIAVATGEGVKAALSAYTYLFKKKGQSQLNVDWGKK